MAARCHLPIRAALASACGSLTLLPGVALARFDTDKFLEGSGVEAAGLNEAIAALTLTIALTGIGWIWIGAYRAWTAGDLTIAETAFTILRSCMVVLVLGFFIR